ncbi:MAG: OB-fold nucleic acid binding domain-containing protein [Bacteroidota bacterium]
MDEYTEDKYPTKIKIIVVILFTMLIPLKRIYDQYRSFQRGLKYHQSNEQYGFHARDKSQMDFEFQQDDELKIIKACYAYNYIGNNVIVEGKVVGTYRSAKGHVFLNFEQPYPNQCFTVVIFSSAMKNFGGYFNEKQYLNRVVQVSGFIKQYKGKPEIIVNFPEQLKIAK